MQGYRCVQSCLSLYGDIGDLNLGSHVCTTNHFTHGAIFPVPSGSSSSYIAQSTLELMIPLPQSLVVLVLQEYIFMPSFC